MRTLLAAFALLSMPLLAAAQDAGAAAAQAAQQATQQSQEASMQAMQANQQASAAGQQAMMQASQNATQAQQACCYAMAATPKFSVKPGKYAAPTTVKITDRSRGATIYYTTDGWTPTVNSLRYRGPLTLDSTTNLQAIAVAPYAWRSLVAAGTYEITAPAAPDGTAPNVPQPEPNNVAPGYVPVQMIFAADVSSKTASVGDKVAMTVAEDFVYHGNTIKQGTPASATITAVDRNGPGGAPGVLTFEMDPITHAGGSVPVAGGATREGDAKPPNAAVLIPIVGPLTVLKHGTDAVIEKGTAFTAYLGPSN